MVKQPVEAYTPQQHVRIVTAASLFDGHDAAINIMRRVLQGSGAEVIHLGHNRSVEEIVNAAIQEDAQAIAITSYQGGHLEFFRYMHDLLQQRGAGHIRIFGGGGGTILPAELEQLHAYGVTRLYSPDDGREMGLQGMINDLLRQCDFPLGDDVGGSVAELRPDAPGRLARLITSAESFPERFREWWAAQPAAEAPAPPVLGVTGTGGAGKSSLVDELVRRFLIDFPDKTLAILSVDPSRRRSGGALLGDRIRMNAVHHPRVFMRSMATRQSNLALSRHVTGALQLMKRAGYDLIILESSGIGQSDTEIVDHADLALYVMTPEYGAASQLEKIDMLDFADVVAINKFDKRGAEDARRDVRKQWQRNRLRFDEPPEQMPVFGTIASQFNDPGTHALYRALMDGLVERTGAPLRSSFEPGETDSAKIHIIPPARVRYLSEIAETNRAYERWVEEQVALARTLYGLRQAQEAIGGEAAGSGQEAGETQAVAEKPEETAGRQGTASSGDGDRGDHRKGSALGVLEEAYREAWAQLDPRCRTILEEWPERRAAYRREAFEYQVRGRAIRVPTQVETLSHTRMPRVALPRYADWGEILRWTLQENVPGSFPYTAGVFPFKRQGEDPTRMFAGEGGPERTNRRFHYLSQGMPAKRLSTAFDSVTLYGEDPAHRPDIYGKVGNSGVSICCLDDAKKLYSGFDLCDPRTSVSMTINGPAATMTAFFMNAAIDQQCEQYIREHGLEDRVEARLVEKYDDRGLPRPAYRGELPEGNDGLGLLLLGLTGDEVLEPEVYAEQKARALRAVRGTVQADILKEDQAQNTCIFSTEFSLKLMGDVQAYFTGHGVRNFYSVSISGYHIAEAGANPITQLAFTLANGFTYVEYYLARGMHIDDFAPNLSFFFSNGLDPEYAVIGRVARRIWAVAMREKYGANDRSQKLKYHIQTSGRSLHAQEIAFNDIRTTLQALYAIYDNCNSLHTNAYDEAITTPTEESVRRAIAIQLIINKELGLARNENPLQGSFIIEELTDLVEEAVLAEFDRLTERGGVLGAMERMYQRGRIQEESLYYEQRKHSGALPVVGVNTFLSSEGSPTVVPGEVIRATPEEKAQQIETVEQLQAARTEEAAAGLRQLQRVALQDGNLFEQLMETVKCASLGQITHALYEVGGQYRRNM